MAFFISNQNNVQLETPVVAALNHVLGRESWARERLAPFAGEGVEVRAPLLPSLRLRIEEGGHLGPAPAGEPASLCIRIGGDAPAAMLKGEDHLLRAIEVTGNARLAEVVAGLVRHLRWDFEEDLSRVFGDVLAHRMGEAARALAAWAPDTAARAAESLAAYATDEARLLLGRAELNELAAGVAELRDAVERLEARIRRHG